MAALNNLEYIGSHIYVCDPSACISNFLSIDVKEGNCLGPRQSCVGWHRQLPTLYLCEAYALGSGAGQAKAATITAKGFAPLSLAVSTVVRKRSAGAVQLMGLKFQGIKASTFAFGQRLALRSRVCVAQALGSTSFILQVCSRVAMVAQVRPPPAEPAKSAFFRVMVWGLMARSTMLESISTRPSLRYSSSAARRERA